jgi:hypothetical protein
LFACILAANFIIDNAAVITAVVVTAAVTLPWATADTPRQNSNQSAEESITEAIGASLTILGAGEGVIAFGQVGSLPKSAPNSKKTYAAPDTQPANVGKAQGVTYESLEDAQREIGKWKVNNNLANSDAEHLDAVRIERQGGQVFPGSTYNHSKDVASARQGLENARKRIEAALQSPNWNAEARAYFLEQQEVIMARLEAINNAFK